MIRRFHFRLSWIPYRWIERLDARLHARGDHTGWDWVCNLKDRRLGWQDDERLFTRPRIVYDTPRRLPPRG